MKPLTLACFALLSALGAATGCKGQESSGDPGGPAPGDCAIPEPSCPAGTHFSVSDCACVSCTTTAGSIYECGDAPAVDSGSPDAGVLSDCPLPEPTCATGTQYSVSDCACVACPTTGGDIYQCGDPPAVDSGAPDTGVLSDCPLPEPACATGTQYSVSDCACVACPTTAGNIYQCGDPPAVDSGS